MRLLLLFLSSFVLVACKERENKIFSANQVTLIFNNFPKENHRVIVGNSEFSANYEVGYLNDSMRFVSFFFDDSLASDTLKIVTSRKAIEVVHTIGLLQEFAYQFKNGDTAIFTYRGGIPEVKLVNRDVEEWEINYDSKKRELLSKCDVLSCYRFCYPFFFKKAASFNFSLLGKVDTCYAAAASKEMEKEVLLLDSLVSANKISNSGYSLFRRRLLTNVLQCKRMGLEFNSSNISKLVADTLLLSSDADSLVFYSYYRAYYGRKIHSLLKDIPVIQSLQGGRLDFCAEFDTIAQLPSIGSNMKKYLLIERLSNIFRECSSIQAMAYAKKFEKVTGDKATVSVLNKELNMDKAPVAGLVVQNNKTGKELNLDAILMQNRGKVVYLDFWASWCAPCRASMPASEKLRADYKGKEVAFVYIDMDENEKAWIAASKLVFPSDFLHNYRAVSPKASCFVKAIDLNSIPRYLLFSKEGKLVHANAPGPEGAAIRKELDRLLKE